MPISMVSALANITGKLLITTQAEQSFTVWNVMPLAVLPFDQQYKHLSLCSTLMGDIAAEKEDAQAKKRSGNWKNTRKHEVLSLWLDKLLIKFGVSPVWFTICNR